MSRVVIAAHARMLRNPLHEAYLAQYWRDKGLSATATADKISYTPYYWHIAGNSVLTHEVEEIDIERMDLSDDPFSYTVDGMIVFVEKHLNKRGKIITEQSIPLLNTNWAFGKDPRRTMNRFFAKANAPSRNRVKTSQLSLMFWADVSQRIQQEE